MSLSYAQSIATNKISQRNHEAKQSWPDSPKSSSYDIIKLETKLAKLMAYLSIPKCVIEDDPVEEEDDSSLSEVDRLVKENAKLKKMLGLA